MNWQEKQKRDSPSEEEWKIVEERLKTMPSKMKLGILSNSYSKEGQIEKIKDELKFFRDLHDRSWTFDNVSATLLSDRIKSLNQKLKKLEGDTKDENN